MLSRNTFNRDREPVLVTGGSGLLGNNIVRALLDAGRSVRTSIRHTYERPSRPFADLVDDPRLEIVPCQLTDESCVERLLDGVGGLIHAAGNTHLGRREQDALERDNVLVPVLLHRLASRNRVPMVHVSSIDAVDPHAQRFSPYARSKSRAEAQLLDTDAPPSIVRPSYLFGPYDWKPSSGRMILAVAHNQGFFPPRGGNTFTDATLVARWCVHALDELTRTGRHDIYQPGGTALDYLPLWRMIADITGGHQPLFRAGPMLVLAAGLYGDMQTLLTNREGDLNGISARLSFQRRDFSQPSHALRIERPSLEESITRAWKWFQSTAKVQSSPQLAVSR